ncbi:MAG: cellulase family glycosylhydrolase [Anaerolineae bacterium]|nr:cellulase family glycosylhydrolase [Anaerolineae bacterium]
MSRFLSNAAGLSGRRLIVAAVVWAVMIIAGGFCLWWGFASPETTEEPATEPASTATDVTTSPPLPTNTPPIQPDVAPPGDAGPEAFGYGIAADALLLPEYTTIQVQNLGLGWIKQQLRWEDFSPGPGEMDWSGYDAVVDEANQHGLKVMLSVVGAPAWSRSYFDSNPEAAPPDDFADFTAFLGQLVDRYQGRIHAIEVWNEQNLDREWDTAEGVSAARYVEMLRLAYQTIKSRDPNIIVISGALSPVGASATDPNNPARVIYLNDRDYFQQMINQGFLDYCDCVGAHHNGYNIPPDVRWNDAYQDDSATFRGFWDNPDISWSFRSTLEEYHNQIVAAGRDTPLCVTEFGWASDDGLGGYPPGFEFARDNSLEEQATYDVQAFHLMREWGFVRLAFLWNLDYANKGPRTPDDPNAPYSIVDYDGAPRPAFGAIGAMDKP